MKKLLMVAILTVVFLLPVWAQSAAEKGLIKVENDWGNAWIKGDAKFLEQLYATEYWATGADGKTYNRTESLKEDLSATYTDKSLNLSELKAHVYGQTGVVTGRNMVKYKVDGKVGEDDLHFTDVFVKRDGRWQCVATQATRIEKK